MLIKCLAEIVDFKEIAEKVKYMYITSNGVLISHRNTRNNFVKEPKIVKGSVNQDGYIIDDFYDRRNKTGFRVSRQQLVMMAFKGYKRGDYSLGKEIDHINRIREDNRLENLRIVDRKQNIENSSKAKISLRKFNRDDILEIYRLKFKEKYTYKKIADMFGVKYPTIISICNGKVYQEIHTEEIANFC